MIIGYVMDTGDVMVTGAVKRQTAITMVTGAINRQTAFSSHLFSVLGEIVLPGLLQGPRVSRVSL